MLKIGSEVPLMRCAFSMFLGIRVMYLVSIVRMYLLNLLQNAPKLLLEEEINWAIMFQLLRDLDQSRKTSSMREISDV